MSLTFNFKSWKRIAFSFVALLLCFILVLAPFRVSAVSGVDDALFWILVAILGASGISFVSLSDAHTQCDSFYNSLSDSIKDTLTEKANLIAGSSAIVSGVKVGVHFLAEQWRQLTTAIVNKYGNKGTLAVEGYQAGRKLDVNNLKDKFLGYSYYNVGQITTSKINNLTMTTFAGSDFADVVNLSAEQLANINTHDDYVYRYFNVGCGLFTSYSVMSYTTSTAQQWQGYFGWYQDRGYITDVSFQTADMLSKHFKYFSGELLKVTDVVRDSIHYKTIYTETLSNIVDLTTGTLVNTSISVPQAVIDRAGVWTGTEWGQFVNDLIFGNDISGLINCDPSAYPNIDTWHDGIGEDVATVDNPVGSIGISVPTSNDDVIDLSPSTARDYDGTTIKDKDITTTSNPDDTGNSNDDDDTNTNPKKDTPSKILPGLSLPEILFKHKFPFCLPYDIYAMCLGLRSDNAEPPVFLIPYKNETLNIDLEYTIDFEDFDEIISILRFFVGATFTVGLIFATRKLIWK